MHEKVSTAAETHASRSGALNVDVRGVFLKLWRSERLWRLEGNEGVRAARSCSEASLGQKTPVNQCGDVTGTTAIFLYGLRSCTRV